MSQQHWALDLGTTNSLVARWNEEVGQPEVVSLPEICRTPPEGCDDLKLPSLVPSCVLFHPRPRFADRLGSRPLLLRRFFLGSMGLIGQRALDRWVSCSATGFVPVFKPYLGRESYRVVARVGRHAYTTRQAAMVFIRELLSAATRLKGERPRDMVFTTPVDSYEPYRAELRDIAGRLGIRRFRTLDEPVAAALGYGLGLGAPVRVLAINFGAGTFDAAIVEMDRDSTTSGTCRVVAKDGIALGGNLVDAWLVEEFFRRIGEDMQAALSLDRAGPSTLRVEWWYQALLREACRVKETLYTRERDHFLLVPPPEALRIGSYVDTTFDVDFTRPNLVELLTRNGLYRAIDLSLDRALQQAAESAPGGDKIDEVIMVGGSTLLPDVYSRIATRFGRDRIRAWQPFEAVVYGGCIYGAGAIEQVDVILHDYAFVTYDRETHQPQYQVIVPRGTRIPTAPAFWKRQLTPTCALGEPEKIFTLRICEVGRAHSDHRQFVWDQHGKLHAVGAGEAGKVIVVPLNDSNPALGYLDPPHDPRERSARLDIEFSVDADRWLSATVYDLRTRRHLMQDEPVVRLQ